MKKLTRTERNKLIPVFQKRQVKAPELYEQLLSMKKGDELFMSNDEWESYGYYAKTFREWWSSTAAQNRSGHRTRLTDLKLEIKKFTTGCSVKRI